MTMQPYLMFNGTCDQAMAFYGRTVGATVNMTMRFKESPDPEQVPAGMGEMVMHACLTIGDANVFVSDGGACPGGRQMGGFSLALTVESVADAQDKFAKLAEGGRVDVPLAKTFWSPAYGLLTDKFGLSWMVMANP